MSITVRNAIRRLECGNTAHSKDADYIKLAIVALEKQIPKAKITLFNNLCGTCECGEMVLRGANYCSGCGQRLKW